METFRSLVEIIALISATALCIYLILTLIRLKDILTLLQKDLSEIGAKAKPVLGNLEVITEKLKSVSTKIDSQVEMVKGSLESVKNAANDIVTFERRIQETLEEPFLRLTAVLTAIVNRITSFFGAGKSSNE